ncbi:hypothetical protein OSH08_05045 [Kaistia geumhonensis]|uniref:Phosphate/sulfate permease n=1 Tax=Kaistia geumhonensis TaxID=410839 RepID=A0ABU0M632_9HYPH|nr:hypothetical protein [Kaistia geumhonensis]MCX5478358.1 hypothetical protein [Kaistia geumhonensis]MDQ0516424.1 phosphate/sulfate permease [Kaistia geumhonensis]
MSGIFAALASVATAVATEATARTLKKLAWMALAAVFILLGVAFAGAAGYDALVVALGPRTAKLIFAGTFVLIGLIIMVSVNYGGRSRRRRPESGDTTTAAVAFAMGLLSGLGRRR